METARTAVEAAREPTRRQRWLALAVLALAVLVVAVDATVLALATPFLSEELKPSSTQLLWIGDVYSFVIAGLLVSMGSLGDRVGRKRMLLTGSVVFGALSALTAYAHSAEAMIAWRALMGVAGATLMPSTLALIRNIFHDPRERSVAVGVWGAMASAGAAVGPVLGGLLLDHFWWGSVFLINLPVMGVLVLVGVRLLPESRDPSPGPWDLPSVALSMIGVLGVVYAVKEAAAYGLRWDVGAAVALGALALAAFTRRQLRLDAPLLDMRLFRHRGFSGAVLADLLTIFGLAGLVFFLSQFLQLVQGRSPFEAGLAELPAGAGAIAAGLVAGSAARRASVRAAVCGGLTACGLALCACAFLSPAGDYRLLGLLLLVLGLGAGLSFTVTADVILSVVPRGQAGAASAVSETAYELGSALGIALLGSVVTGFYRAQAVPAGTPGEVAGQARASLGGAAEAARSLPGPAGERLLATAQGAFTDGLRAGAVLAGAVLLAAAAVCWRVLRDQRLEG
ncbi:MFS transporter [Streptomyces sp. JJ36]|uniref:MFS transporter n=1 Tax=Streptomyces sp. JJ36 TaxID=2736645 RepID=UPI001F00A5B4|nr:MFS transporter [Streptomyces sp. JJ36]MCF6523160.1 MFS transporter [Streptomyces sp. JJ36]